MEEELKLTTSQWMKVVIALAIVVLVSACGKKQVATPPPAPPPPQLYPTATLTANPNTISPGQSTTLTWTTEHATEVTIDQIGKVDPSGSSSQQPTQSTTYHLVAKNSIGTQEATARVTVAKTATPPPAETSNNAGDASLFAQNMKDVFFAYDSYDIESQYQGVLQADARFLKQHP